MRAEILTLLWTILAIVGKYRQFCETDCRLLDILVTEVGDSPLPSVGCLVSLLNRLFGNFR